MKAPKKVWVDSTSLVARDRNMYECDTAYVRADLVDGLVAALNAIIARWDTPLWKDAEPTSVCIGKGRAALKALEEE